LDYREIASRKIGIDLVELRGVEPHGDILTVLSELAELTKKLELLDYKGSEWKELCYVM